MIKIKIDESITVILAKILHKYGYKADTVYTEKNIRNKG